MFNNYLGAFTFIIALSINVLTQIISFRYFAIRGLLNSIFLGFVFGLLSLLLFEFHIFNIQPASIKDFIPGFIVHLITYICLGYCYFHFINLGETARRIRILRELKNAPEGLSLEELQKRYNAKEITERRLSRLIQTRQIILRDGKYYTGKPLVLAMAKSLAFLKFILLGRKI